MKIAVPTTNPGGIDAEISAHFGHCDVFTLITLEEKNIIQVDILQNPGHEQGGCMAPVMLLKEADVEALVAGGMGMRPLQGFQQVGIDVYFSENATIVSEVIQLITADQARKFAPAQACGGSGGCGSSS